MTLNRRTFAIISHPDAGKTTLTEKLLLQGGAIHLAGGAANAALMLATAGLANAYAAQGIRVNAINPGLTRTDRLKEGLAADARLQGIENEEAMKRAVAKIPMGRMAEPEEIARVVLFLASDAASYVTGINMSMDGATTPLIV